MDVYCKRCGEPWDLYGVQHGDMTATERDRFWAGEGCPSCCGKEPCHSSSPCDECPDAELVGPFGAPSCRVNRDKRLARQPFRAQLTAVLHEVLGDDLDGLAAELEDAEYLMGENFYD
jgi:hypothetical protein